MQALYGVVAAALTSLGSTGVLLAFTASTAGWCCYPGCGESRSQPGALLLTGAPKHPSRADAADQRLCFAHQKEGGSGGYRGFRCF